MIHPTALVHPKAELDSTVEVGPYAVIEQGVQAGPGCVIGPYVHIKGITCIGERNHFYSGCVVGEAPQDLKYRGAPSRLRIGGHNVFREHVTLNRANTTEHDTVIGSHNLLMAHVHIAHDIVLGDYVILAGGALLAGHVHVADRAFISGNCLVHQFVRIGTLAMMRGGAAISKDLPPYTVARGENHLCGLNIVGLRRAGISPADRLELKQLYRALFRMGKNLGSALNAARDQFSGAPAREMLDFLAGSKRGVCSHLMHWKRRELDGEVEELAL